jgi:hypothetical protein
MPKHRFVITALAALLAGYLGGAISRPVPLAAEPSMPSKLPQVSPDLCWHPGLERNIGIAEMPCPMIVRRW